MAAGEPRVEATTEALPPARVRTLALMVLAGLALYLCWQILEPFSSVLLWAAVLAILFAPLRERLERKTGRANLAAALTLAVAIVSVLLPLGLVAFSLASEVADWATGASADSEEFLAGPELRIRLLDLYAQARERFPLVDRLDRDQIVASLQSISQTIVSHALALAGGVLQAAVEFVLIGFTLFFFLRDGEKLAAELRELLPLGRRQSTRLLERLVEVLRASTFGVIVVAVAQGFLGGAMFAVLGLPSPVLWGVVMTLFGMVPMVGTGIVWLPASAYLLLTDRTAQGLILLAWGALVVATIDNLLRPWLVGQRSRLHELVVFFGVLGGIQVFGLVGIFVGPMAFAVAAALVGLARERNGRNGHDGHAPSRARREAAA